MPGFDERAKNVVMNLLPDNMSSDELIEKSWPPTFNIIKAQWMSDAMRKMLHGLDAMREHMLSHKIISRKNGNIPRLRQASTLSINSTAPVGLPRACYSASWLSRLRGENLREIKVKEIDVRLGIPIQYKYMFAEAREIPDYI